MMPAAMELYSTDLFDMRSKIPQFCYSNDRLIDLILIDMS